MAEAREKTGLSQNEAANKAGFSQQNLSRYEAGLIEPSPGVLLRLAYLYNESVDFILTGQRVFGSSSGSLIKVPEWLRPHIQAMESLSEFDSGRLEGRIAGWLESLTANSQPEETSEQGEENQIAVAGAPRSRDGTR